MKNILFLLALTATSFNIYGEVLSPADALLRAESSVSSHKMPGLKTSTPRLIKTINAESQPAVYLFNRGSEAGYMVISADDATQPMLGFCDEGCVDADNIPPALSYWMESYASEIEYIREHPSHNKAIKQSDYFGELEPMCKTIWNQAAPFYNKCPEYASGYRSSTGCMATALAQILKYFNYPKKGSGSYSYSWTNKYNSSTKTLSYDFDANSFDWDNMLDSYNGSYTQTQANAVAELMYSLGVVLDMNYGSSSGALGYSALNTFTYLGLDPGMTYVERNFYTAADWNKLIYDALSVGPVLYGGQSDAGGHAFVCDGYSNGYFHINWGWGGYYNGYFLLSALDSESSTDVTTTAGYNTKQHAVLYIQPEKAGSTPGYNVSCDSFNISQSSAYLGSWISITSYVLDRSTDLSAITLGVKITDSNGKEYISTGRTVDAPTRKTGYAYSVMLPSNLSDGSYKVTPIFETEDGVVRDINCEIAGVKSYTMTVSNSTASLIANATPNVVATDVTVNTPIYKGQSFDATLTLLNDSNEEFAGYVALALYDYTYQSYTSYQSDIVPVTVPANSEIEFEYQGTFYDLTYNYSNCGVQLLAMRYDMWTGKYYVIDAISDAYDVVRGISTDTPSYAITASKLAVENSSVVNKHDVRITADISCNSGYFNKSISAFVFPITGGNSVGTLCSGNIYLNEGETKTISITGEFPDAEAKTSYFLALLDGDSNSFLTNASGNRVMTVLTVADDEIKQTTGIDDVDSDSDVVKVEYYTLQGVITDSDNLQPGIYVKVVTRADGSRNSSRIQLK